MNRTHRNRTILWAMHVGGEEPAHQVAALGGSFPIAALTLEERGVRLRTTILRTRVYAQDHGTKVAVASN